MGVTINKQLVLGLCIRNKTVVMALDDGWICAAIHRC